MEGYAAFCDDLYFNMNLATQMDLPTQREQVLYHFEQVRRTFPSMQNFYSREPGEFVLEEDKEGENYGWTSIETRRINCGIVNPKDYEQACRLHRFVLEQVPYTLSISPLDCETISVVFGFDFLFRGDQNAVLTEALGVVPGFEKLLGIPGMQILGHDPVIQFSLDDSCRTQCRIACETRTTAYQVRTGDYPEEPLSVYLTVRRFDSLGGQEDYASEFSRLAALGKELVDEYLVDQVLRPLQQIIALR